MPDKKDLEIVILPEAEADIARLIAEHPEAKEVFTEMFANFHQAMEAVKAGRYASFEDAVEAITGERPVEIDVDP